MSTQVFKGMAIALVEELVSLTTREGIRLAFIHNKTATSFDRHIQANLPVVFSYSIGAWGSITLDNQAEDVERLFNPSETIEGYAEMNSEVQAAHRQKLANKLRRVCFLDHTDTDAYAVAQFLKERMAFIDDERFTVQSYITIKNIYQRVKDAQDEIDKRMAEREAVEAERNAERQAARDNLLAIIGDNQELKEALAEYSVKHGGFGWLSPETVERIQNS